MTALDFFTDLANTTPSASRTGTDELPTPEALVELVTRALYSGRIDGDQRELDDVLRFRQRIRAVWSLDGEPLVERINEMLREANALPFLVRHDGLDWHLHATSPDAPLAERMSVEAALALSEVVRMDAVARMRVCAADDCDGLLMDLSRNGSKRFCSVRCSNRVNMIAFRERQQDRGDDAGRS
ncbi:CGNR zinc finger domain-containing protein [Naasia lichenicola]|uniref:CGNR zinc finger domain-containing protein n=1 Tax=Naasia lichenicola TaxID=2565933 RepID=A0A4S4FP45_9MICO|nr:CGNR zinc finger domain-containing protein [Naasia lichenicola]THG31046.1 CGNR zinc finger domain-containing protein [Naasia lichenicola]